MCWTCVESSAVSLVEGFASGVLQNYVNNSGRETRSGNDRTFPETWEGLADSNDYDQRDVIYEEFDSSSVSGSSDNDNSEMDYFLAWRQARPTKRYWLWSCFKCSLDIFFMGGWLIGGVSMALVYLDLNTADACPQFNSNWDAMPKIVQNVRVVSQMIEGWCLQFFHFVTMVFLFNWAFIKELGLLSWNLVAAFSDSTYRALLQIFGMYHQPWMSYVLNVLFIFTTTFNSYTIAKRRHHRMAARLMLTFQLGSQFLVGAVVIYATVYLIIPWFVQLTALRQAFAAAGIPILGALAKATSRMAAQNLLGVNHPGTSYVLMLACYSGSAIVYRILQSELENFKYFALLCVAFGLMGLLERTTLVVRDHAFRWLWAKCCKRSVDSRWGHFRTPRTQRLAADITLSGMLIDSYTVVLVIFFTNVYHYQDGKSITSDRFVVSGEFWSRSGVALGIELFFNTIGIFILTWHLNVPLLRVWKLKWKSLVVVNLSFCSFLVLYATEYLVKVMEDKYRLRQHELASQPNVRNCITA